jgi:hypothetical protein
MQKVYQKTTTGTAHELDHHLLGCALAQAHRWAAAAASRQEPYVPYRTYGHGKQADTATSGIPETNRVPRRGTGSEPAKAEVRGAQRVTAAD